MTEERITVADLEYFLRSVERVGPDEPGSGETLREAVIALLVRAIQEAVAK